MRQYTKISMRDAYVNKHLPECARVLANVYWRVLLFLSLIIVLLAFVYGSWKLSVVIEESVIAPSQNTNKALPATTLNKTLLQNTLISFSERETRFNSLKTSAKSTPDPSR